MNTAATSRRLVAALLAQHGRTFAGELGISLERNTPSPLFRWLTAALLLSARIPTEVAMRAARALAEAGWTTPQKLAASSWRQRTRVLNRAGYARYDERTATMLAATATRLLDDYRGDLRRLRGAAGGDVARARALLKRFSGVGDVGADIFLREVQSGWGELYPFADRKALATADRLGLPGTAEKLARLVDRAAFPALLAALVRVGLDRRGDAAARLTAPEPLCNRAGNRSAGSQAL